jgi:class 3 adenylate cyclase
MPAVPENVTSALLIINVAIVSVVVFTMTVLMVSELNDARSRADGLLLNILPGPIAERLKRNPEIIADRFDEVTILFADIVDFTRLSAGADPREVVTMLNNIFSDFDTLALKHGLEKIKTIGDAYMLAGGLPFERPDHAVAVVEFAMDMLKALETRRTWNDQPIRVRIGINTGPVVAGVIGKHKFIYDLWGDAVNTASRMESCGLSNTIQVTESTYQRLKDRYQFEERGVVNIKGKGEMTTYLLLGRKSAAGGDHHPFPAS